MINFGGCTGNIKTQSDEITYNGDLKVTTKGYDNQIKINSKDGDYENIIVRRIKDSSTVDVTIKLTGAETVATPS